MGKLYELTGEMLEIEALLESGELSFEELKDQIEATTIQYDGKCRAVLMVRQNAIMQADGIQAEIDRLTALQAAPRKTVDYLESYLKDSMIALNKDKLDLGIFKVTLRKATIQLGAIDETKIPADYFVVIPEEKKLDKKKLLSDAKLRADSEQDQITGVTLGESKRGLTIK